LPAAATAKPRLSSAAPSCARSVQLFLLLALLMALFTMSAPELVRLGLWGDYLRRHRWLYASAALALATYVPHRAYSLVGGHRARRPLRSRSSACTGYTDAAPGQPRSRARALAPAPQVLVARQAAGAQVWEASGFWALWVLQRLALLAFYCSAGLHAALALAPDEQLAALQAALRAAEG
jgi:hypothetical protein